MVSKVVVRDLKFPNPIQRKMVKIAQFEPQRKGEDQEKIIVLAILKIQGKI